MDAIIDASAHALAERIRLERRARGWSLADLAERSGVAKATISRIENAGASPTAVILMKLAGAFDLTLAGFPLARNAALKVCRAPPINRCGGTRRQATSAPTFSRPDHPLEIARIELPAGRKCGFPAASYAHIRQAVWVLAGQLVVVNDGERHVLELATASASARPRTRLSPTRAPRPRLSRRASPGASPCRISPSHR